MHREVIIVGGGLAGLVIARSLARRGESVQLLEAAPRLGGRIRTVYDKEHIAYESGPWRVPETHQRVRALFEQEGVALVPMQTRPLPTQEPPVRPGLSTWEVNALRTRDPLRADAMDLDTGYADQTHSASGSAPYEAPDAATYFVAPDGFSGLVARLAAALPEDAVFADHRVVDVTRGKDGRYNVAIAVRTGHNAFGYRTCTCARLFICVPPGVFRSWTIMKEHARSMSCAVTEGDLHHIYVASRDVPRGVHVKTPLLGQVVSSQYDHSDWFQASYSGGRIARLWHRLRMASPTDYWSTLRDELRRAIGVDLPPDAEERSHYWSTAFHAWRPVPDFDLARAVRTAVQPNPERLPRVYVAGEAFSSHQAWMEGALETAELALAADDGRLPGCIARASKWVRVEGHFLDVEQWMMRHPGGIEPLRNHIGEDVTALMDHVGHSDHAWAVVHSLKCR